MDNQVSAVIQDQVSAVIAVLQALKALADLVAHKERQVSAANPDKMELVA